MPRRSDLKKARVMAQNCRAVLRRFSFALMRLSFGVWGSGVLVVSFIVAAPGVGGCSCWNGGEAPVFSSSYHSFVACEVFIALPSCFWDGV